LFVKLLDAKDISVVVDPGCPYLVLVLQLADLLPDVLLLLQI
jgi:hypothetical protein